MARTLPFVKINYDNGALGQTSTMNDGLMLLVACHSTAVSGKFSLSTPYSIRQYSDLEARGITAANNEYLERIVREFYTTAADGTQCYIVGYPATVNVATALNKNNTYVRRVLEQLNGEIRGVAIYGHTGDVFDDNYFDAMEAAQELGEWAAASLYAPIFTLLSGEAYAANLIEDAPNWGDYTYNRVGVVLGSPDADYTNIYIHSIGLIAGRIASVPVHRNIGRVADGALDVPKMWIGGIEAERADVATLVEKGYITFRTYVGKSGYYIADDSLATGETDDYNSIARRRVIDKAYRIAYSVLVEQLLDEIPVNSNGTMMETYAASFELKVENAIATYMTANGELSTDPDDSSDRGVECTVDRTVNVLSTGKIEAELRVRPHGYGKYITVLLGFTVVTT